VQAIRCKWDRRQLSLASCCWSPKVLAPRLLSLALPRRADTGANNYFIQLFASASLSDKQGTLSEDSMALRSEMPYRQQELGYILSPHWSVQSERYFTSPLLLSVVGTVGVLLPIRREVVEDDM